MVLHQCSTQAIAAGVCTDHGGLAWVIVTEGWCGHENRFGFVECLFLGLAPNPCTFFLEKTSHWVQNGVQTWQEFAHIVYQTEHLAKLLHICGVWHFGDAFHFAVVRFDAISANNVLKELQFCFPELAPGSIEFKARCFNRSQHFIQAAVLLLSVGPEDEDVVHHDDCPLRALDQGAHQPLKDLK